MRKFTKQISTLIALATAVSANSSTINAESTPTAGVMMYTETEITPTAGVMMYTETEMTPLMGDVYYTSYPEIVSTIGTIVNYNTETTTMTTYDMPIGTFMNTDDDYWEFTTTYDDYSTTYDMPIGTYTTSNDYEYWGTLETTTTTSLGTWATDWSYSTTPQNEIYSSFYGDIDLSGKITNADLVLICQALIKDVDLIAQQKAYADINQDGDFDIADAAMIKSHLLGDKVPNIDYPLTTTTEPTEHTTTTTTTTTYDMPIGTFVS